jgi:hypothetical protein
MYALTRKLVVLIVAEVASTTSSYLVKKYIKAYL